VRVTFEVSYSATACLAEAYEQLAPILRRLLPQENGRSLGLPAEPLRELGASARREGRR
jgi:hypothetical protein